MVNEALSTRLSSLADALAPLDSDASENLELAAKLAARGNLVDAYVAISGLGRSLDLEWWAAGLVSQIVDLEAELMACAIAPQAVA